MDDGQKDVRMTAMANESIQSGQKSEGHDKHENQGKDDHQEIQGTEGMTKRIKKRGNDSSRGTNGKSPYLGSSK